MWYSQDGKLKKKKSTFYFSNLHLYIPLRTNMLICFLWNRIETVYSQQKDCTVHFVLLYAVLGTSNFRLGRYLSIWFWLYIPNFLFPPPCPASSFHKSQVTSPKHQLFLIHGHIPLHLNHFEMSFTYMTKSTGPSTEPRESPHLSGRLLYWYETFVLAVFRVYQCQMYITYVQFVLLTSC